MPFFVGLGVLEKENLEPWPFLLRVGTGGGSKRVGLGARDDARLEATRAFANSSPVRSGVDLRGLAALNCAGMDSCERIEETDIPVDCALIGRGDGSCLIGIDCVALGRDGDGEG